VFLYFLRTGRVHPPGEFHKRPSPELGHGEHSRNRRRPRTPSFWPGRFHIAADQRPVDPAAGMPDVDGICEGKVQEHRLFLQRATLAVGVATGEAGEESTRSAPDARGGWVPRAGQQRQQGSGYRRATSSGLSVSRTRNRDSAASGPLGRDSSRAHIAPRNNSNRHVPLKYPKMGVSRLQPHRQPGRSWSLNGRAPGAAQAELGPRCRAKSAAASLVRDPRLGPSHLRIWSHRRTRLLSCPSPRG
jgi:hypothetical protein